MNEHVEKFTKHWFCYLVGCADGTIYCGITDNLEKRMATHNAGKGAKYTRGRGPVQLMHAELCADKSAAMKREKHIKRLTQKEKKALYENKQETDRFMVEIE